MIDLILAAAIAMTGPSDPEDATPYVLLAWQVPGGPNNIWEPDQILANHIDLAEPSLSALDTSLPCGTYYQLDLEWDSETTRALIAGGILRNPGDPTEDHAYGTSQFGNQPWTYLQTAPCAEKPEPRPFVYDNQTSNCDVTTTVHQEGFYDLTFDNIANVWTEAATPTLTVDTSTSVPVSEELRPAECAPLLANTGADFSPLWWPFAATLTALGVVLLLLRRQVSRV